MKWIFYTTWISLMSNGFEHSYIKFLVEKLIGHDYLEQTIRKINLLRSMCINKSY